MKLQSIHTKLIGIVGVFVLGLTGYMFYTSSIMTEDIESSDYADIVTMKDLIADVLPPPLYVIEAYLTALELEKHGKADRASGGEQVSEQLKALRDKWSRLQTEYAARVAYWQEQLPAGPMRDVQLAAVIASAEEVFRIGRERLLPSLTKGDGPGVDQSMKEIEAAYGAQRKAVDVLVAAATQRAGQEIGDAASEIHSRKQRLLLLGGLVVLIGSAMTLIVARSISRRAQELAGALRLVAAGDLTQRANLSSDDEIGQMATQLNVALESIENAFVDVRNVVATLRTVAGKLAASSDQMSSGAQQQAASLEETAASLEEITATIKQSAGNAQQASQLALGSRDVAERGGEVVAQAVGAMQQITEASRKIGDIITTIDEIALQTNLLALNAAVEAARAGEQGRGFAVVASEVGNLAQRSAAAAKEVKVLIQDSLQRVESGHELVHGSGKALKEIISSVKKVTDIVGEIAAAAREQSVGVDQVNTAVSQMDQVTQSNAAQTEELSISAEEVEGDAQRLQTLLGSFQLRRDRREPTLHRDDDDGRDGRPSAKQNAKRTRRRAAADSRLLHSERVDGASEAPSEFEVA